jgi:vesicle coat complex subunit
MYILWICGDSGDNNIQYSTTNYISLCLSLSTMEAQVEKISIATLKEMSDNEVHERLHYLMRVQKEILNEIDICKDRLGMFPISGKCARCGSTNLRPLTRGGYFCRKCSFRHGLLENIIEA